MPETEAEKAEREARESRGRSGPTDEGRGVARKLLNRFRGRAEDAVAHLADENKELREDRRTARAELDKFKAPGTLVLTADDAKAYEAYKSLGMKPDDLKKAVDELPKLRATIVEHDRGAAAAKAAPLLGYNADALRDVVTDKKLEISFVAGVDKDGKAIQVPHVKPAGEEKTAPVPFADYAKANLGTYLPALQAKGSTQAAAAGTPGRTATQYVEQGASSSTAQNGEGGAKPRQPSTNSSYMTPGQRAAKHNATP